MEDKLKKLKDIGISVDILNENDEYSVSFCDNPDVVKYTKVFDEEFKNIKSINSIVDKFLEETIKSEINKLPKELNGCTIDNTTDRTILSYAYVVNFYSKEKFLEWLNSDCVNSFLND